MIQGRGSRRANEGESWWVRGFPRERSARAPRLRAQAPGSTRGANDAPLWRGSVAGSRTGAEAGGPPRGRRAGERNPSVAEPGWSRAARTDRKSVRCVFCPGRAAKGRLRRPRCVPAPPAGRRGAHGAAAGLRVPEPDGERGAGPAWAEAASFPCALPAPPPRRCRQQSGPGARAGLGRARGRRRFSGCAASVAPPFPGQAAASLRGRSVLGASSAVFAGRAALFIYFSKWVLVTGRKLGNSLGLAQSVERGTLDLRVSSGPLLGVEITRKDQL